MNPPWHWQNHRAFVAVLVLAFSLARCGGDSAETTLDVTGSLDQGPADAADVVAVEDLAADVPADESGPDVVGQAKIFPHNPEKDDWETSTVQVGHLTSDDGTLSGQYANVFNCLNEDGGWTREYDVEFLNLGLVHAQLCKLVKTVVPDDDGSYLSIVPPEDLLDPNDSFAELMMYYHVDAIHNYYQEVHGYDGMDFPLEAYVNLQAYLEMETPLPGIPTGWVTFDNAMFVPGESFVEMEEMAEEMLAEFLGIEDDLALPFQNDAILFMQGESLDFAYDADVIYHEYTHAVVGGDRLWGTRIDPYGTDASPMAINEAYADYFSCSVLGDPIMAEFALANLPGGSARDLTEFHKCPDDYRGEEHVDGQMYSSALWAIREALGPELADRIIFNALLTFSQLTGYEEAALATIAEAALLDEPRDGEVEAIFEKHGLLGCNHRVREYADSDPADYPEVLPGTMTTGVPAFADGTPGSLQYALVLPEDVASVTLTVEAEVDPLSSLLGSFLGGGSDVELALAVRRGADAITYEYEPDFVPGFEGLIPFVENDEGLLVATIEGNCVGAGPYVLQFWNLTSESVLVYSMTLGTGAETALEEATFDCLGPCAGVSCGITCEGDEECADGQVCEVYADGCCSHCVAPADPCAGVECAMTCASDEDCPEEHVCEVYADGCCSQCVILESE